MLCGCLFGLFDLLNDVVLYYVVLVVVVVVCVFIVWVVYLLFG